MKKTQQNHVTVVRAKDGEPAVPARNMGHRIAALAVVLAVALFAAANWPKSNQPDSPSNPSPTLAEDPDSSAGFIYFPAQYVNQATEPTEHIQAF